MRQITPAIRATFRLTFTIALIAVLVPACGLGMNNQDRLDRGQQAYNDGEYRAAIIDAKNVLQAEPDNVAGRLLLGRASVKTGDVHYLDRPRLLRL